MAIMFRDESVTVEKKAQQKWRARAKPKTLTDEFYAYLVNMKTPGFAMPMDLFDMARNRFFFDYPLPSDDPDNPQKGVLDYLPGLYAQASSGSPLPAAVNAVCLVNFYRRAGPSLNKALCLAGKAYGEALEGVKHATLNPTQASSDSVVMAVHLLGIYEVSFGFPETCRVINSCSFIFRQDHVDLSILGSISMNFWKFDFEYCREFIGIKLKSRD